MGIGSQESAGHQKGSPSLDQGTRRCLWSRELKILLHAYTPASHGRFSVRWLQKQPALIGTPSNQSRQNPAFSFCPLGKFVGGARYVAAIYFFEQGRRSKGMATRVESEVHHRIELMLGELRIGHMRPDARHGRLTMRLDRAQQPDNDQQLPHAPKSSLRAASACSRVHTSPLCTSGPVCPQPIVQTPTAS